MPKRAQHAFVLAYIDGFQTPTKHPTSGGHVHNLESAV